MRKADEKGNVVEIFDFNSFNCVFFFNYFIEYRIIEITANIIMIFQ